MDIRHLPIGHICYLYGNSDDIYEADLYTEELKDLVKMKTGKTVSSTDCRIVRFLLGWTQEKLGDLLCVSRSTINRYEKGATCSNYLDTCYSLLYNAVIAALLQDKENLDYYCCTLTAVIDFRDFDYDGRMDYIRNKPELFIEEIGTKINKLRDKWVDLQIELIKEELSK